MFGISFFGVTPGFSQKHFCSSEMLLPIIRACSELYTLDQFTVALPAGGTLFVFSGQMVGEHRITFMAQYRHAIEYKGSREGGHYGIGIWLVDSWVSSAVLGLLNKIVNFLQHELVDADGKFFRTFEQVDWGRGPVEGFIQELNEYQTPLPPLRDDITPYDGARKLLLVDEVGTIEFSLTSVQLAKAMEFFAQDWMLLFSRVIYQSSDPNVIKATRNLNRLELTSLDKLVKQYQARLARVTSDSLSSRQRSDSQPQLSLPTMDADPSAGSSFPTTMPVRDDPGPTATRTRAKSADSTQTSGAASVEKRFAAFLAKLRKLRHVILNSSNQSLRLRPADAFIAILTLTAIAFLLVPHSDILQFYHALTGFQKNSRNPSVITSSPTASTRESGLTKHQQQSSDATPEGAQVPCQRTNDPSVPDGLGDRRIFSIKVQELESRIQRVLDSRKKARL